MKPVEARLRELFTGPLTLLENTRFDRGETSNDPAFAQTLADGNDLFVQDAFGSAHRAHASTVGVAQLLPTYAGLLLESELEHLGRLLGEVERPYVLVCGGATVDDKLGVLRHLGGHADSVLVGGTMAEKLRVVNPLRFPVELPVDVVGAARFDAEADARICTIDELPYGWIGLDIGPQTRTRFADVLGTAGTIFWNGPMGVFEWPGFAEGTKAVAEAVAAADAYSVVGGADALRALNELGLAHDVSWASTGGGASLELLEGKELPGVAVIPSVPSPVTAETTAYRLLLLRHGESVWNSEGLFTGWVDVGLSERGTHEAIHAGELLAARDLLPEVVHTSLLARAIRTTGAGARGGRTRVDPGAPVLAAERAPLRRSPGQEQGANESRVRRRAVHALAPLLRRPAAATLRRRPTWRPHATRATPAFRLMPCQAPNASRMWSCACSPTGTTRSSPISSPDGSFSSRRTGTHSAPS